MFLICFALGFDSSEGKKCCVSRAYAVCSVTPNFWENALNDKKKVHTSEQFSFHAPQINIISSFIWNSYKDYKKLDSFIKHGSPYKCVSRNFVGK